MPEKLKQLDYEDFFNKENVDGIGTVAGKCGECNTEYGSPGVLEHHLTKVHKLPALEGCR